MKVIVKNDIGKAKEIKLGFSWTMLFWWFFVPLIRQDWKNFFIYAGVFILLAFLAPFVLPIFTIAFPFFYNKMYAEELYKEGYRGLTEEENKLVVDYISK